MKQSARAFLILWGLVIAYALLTCCCAAPPMGYPAPEAPEASEVTEANLPLLNCIYFERELFLSAVTSPPAYETKGSVLAGMIPHHLLASDMIAGFFTLAASAGEYERVILVSTSHFPYHCGSEVVTSAAGWNTPYGTLKGDPEVAGALLRNSLIAAEDNPFALERDHGASGLMPFIKYYMPETKITAILLANTVKQQRLEEIWQTLEPFCTDKGALLILSADCSHYLMPEEAARRDEETARAIESFDFEQIMRFGDENVDSPQGVNLMLRLTQSRDAELKRLDHSSSAYKLPQGISHPIYAEGITTYFVYAVVESES